MSAGITVLPERSTRVAPAGGWRSPFFPTHVKVSPSTRNAELSIGALPSPTMRRAPSNHVARLGPRCASSVMTSRTIRQQTVLRKSVIGGSLHLQEGGSEDPPLLTANQHLVGALLAFV